MPLSHKDTKFLTHPLNPPLLKREGDFLNLSVLVPLWQEKKGSALLLVMAVIAAGGILVAVIFNQSFRGLKRWEHKINSIQALYLAESGIAHQLYLEKFVEDTLNEMGSLLYDDQWLETEDEYTDEEAIKFYLNPKLPLPNFSSSEEGAFLTITSSAFYKSRQTSIQARFGRALTDSIFSSALVLS